MKIFYFQKCKKSLMHGYDVQKALYLSIKLKFMVPGSKAQAGPIWPYCENI